jgi:hypothetical protein
MAQILLPRSAPRQGEALAQALQIAGSIFGIKGAIEKQSRAEQEFKLTQQVREEQLEEFGRKKFEESQLAKGIITPKMKTSLLLKDFRIRELPKGEVGQFRIEEPITGIRGIKEAERPSKFVELVSPEAVRAEKLAKKEMKKELKEEERFKTGQFDKLSGNVEKLDKEFRPLEKLYGSIEVLRQKFEKDPDSLSPQDRLQLVRATVPLVELNPGVVREAEFETFRSQTSVLEQISQRFEKATTGKGIGDEVVTEIFGSARTLKPVVAHAKADALKRIGNIAAARGLEGQIDILFGDRNLELISDPSRFAVFDVPRGGPRGTDFSVIKDAVARDQDVLPINPAQSGIKELSKMSAQEAIDAINDQIRKIRAGEFRKRK